MDSLNDILQKKNIDEPSEVAIIKRYVEMKFKSTVSVSVRSDHLVIMTPSAALANTMRFNTLELQRIAKTDKKLVFRIGS